MDISKKTNLTMLCDYYELTMGNGYFEQRHAGLASRISISSSARCPTNGGFAIAAGLEQAIEYIQNLHFDEEDIAYLRGARTSSARSFLRLPEELPLHGRYLGRAGGDAHLPEASRS